MKNDIFILTDFSVYDFTVYDNRVNNFSMRVTKEKFRKFNIFAIWIYHGSMLDAFSSFV